MSKCLEKYDELLAVHVPVAYSMIYIHILNDYEETGNPGLIGEEPMTEITLEDAKTMIEAAEEKVDEIEVPMCIAIVDTGANLVGFHRMDGALLASIDIARNKAYSSASLKMPTDEIGEAAQPGESLFGIGNTNGGRIVTFGGGFPVEIDGNVIGAIGVSGGSPEEDMAVARAGLNAFED
jgi:uncharacterized protein GlcG (DUF336 family)